MNEYFNRQTSVYSCTVYTLQSTVYIQSIYRAEYWLLYVQNLYSEWIIWHIYESTRIGFVYFVARPKYRDKSIRRYRLAECVVSLFDDVMTTENNCLFLATYICVKYVLVSRKKGKGRPEASLLDSRSWTLQYFRTWDEFYNLCWSEDAGFDQ